MTYKRFLIFLVLLLALVLIFFIIIIPAFQKPIYMQVGPQGGVNFGDQIILTQIRLEEKNGETRALLFDFYDTATIADDYRIYLHLQPFGGGKMINYDFAPYPPVPFWHPYEIYSQRRELKIAPGRYKVTMGVFYNIQKYLGNPIAFDIIIK